MANIKSAIKRNRQNIKRREHNKEIKSKMRTFIKKVLKAIQDQDLTTAKDVFKETTSILDNTASKGIIHKNKAARHKSRLHTKIKNLDLALNS